MAVAHRRKRTPRKGRTTQAMQPVAEIIGRNTLPEVQASVYRSRFAATTVDAMVPDYAFYDHLRRGKQAGYKLGALFAKRIERVFSTWIWGRGVTVSLVEAGDADNPDNPRNYTDNQLADFLQANHALLLTLKEDVLGLGDQYLVVNADGSLSVPSPDTVEVVRDELDYRTILAIRITTKLQKVTIIDEYRADGRTVTIRQVVDGRTVERVETFANLIGRIPIVHVTYARSGNETNGHSIHEDLLKLYDQYDDVIHKQLDGAKLLGNPILAFVGMENLSAVIDANKPVEPQTYQDMDGNEVTRPLLNIDSNSVMLIGKGGDGKFIAPPTGFTADTQQALKTLFLLLLDRTGIPEFIWGNEMSSARASSDTQMMQWAHDIEGQQKADERWLLDLCDIWLATMALTDPMIVLDALKAEWPPVLDENQELRLKLLEFASSQNLLQDKTKLELTNLPVDDLDDEIEQAQNEAQARAEEQLARMQAQAALQPQDEREEDERNGPPEPVTQMHTNGYHELEAQAIVAGAIRTLTGDA